MQKDALALVRVQIRSVSDDGREATASVLDYAGPDSLPETIDLPRTVDSTLGAGIQPAPCPDSSLRWQPEAEYLVLLRKVTPALVLLDPSGKTAFEISDDGCVQTTSAGTRSPANALLAQFASTHHYLRKSESTPWLLAAAGAVALGAIGTTACLVLRRAKQPTR